MTSPRSVVVREVDPADADRLGDALARAYLAGRIVDEHDEYVPVLRDVAGRLPNVVAVLAAYDGTEVLGGLTLVTADSPEAEVAREEELEIRMLAVAPEHQGRRVSAALLEAAVVAGRRLGYAALVLSSMPAMVAAQRVYLDHGFHRQPERDWLADWDPAAVADGTAEALAVYRLPLEESS